MIFTLTYKPTYATTQMPTHPATRMHTRMHAHTHTQQCQRDLSHSLPLSSELIKPVQRILKYPLLLDDLSKKFDWLDHPGYRLIKEALEKMSSVALRINTAFHDPVSIVNIKYVLQNSSVLKTDHIIR